MKGSRLLVVMACVACLSLATEDNVSPERHSMPLKATKSKMNKYESLIYRDELFVKPKSNYRWIYEILFGVQQNPMTDWEAKKNLIGNVPEKSL